MSAAEYLKDIGPRNVTGMADNVSLWLPRRYLQQHSAWSQPHGPMDFVCITPGYKEVYGQTPSWNDVRQMLHGYSMETILDTISRISAVLYSRDPYSDIQVHIDICRWLFGEQHPQILQTLQNMQHDLQKQGRRSPLPIFHEAQILNLAKVAFLFDGLSNENEKTSLSDLGKALLMTNDLIQDQPSGIATLPPTDPCYRERWLQYLLSNALFNVKETPPHALARCYDLYLTDKPHLHRCKAYVDLPALLTQLTGLSPNEVWSVLFAMGHHWYNVKLQDVWHNTLHLNRHTYFATDFSFSEHETSRFYGLVSIEMDRLKDEIGKRYSLDSIQPYDVLPFQKWPFVSIEDKLYCVSTKLFFEKLTRGLHHMFLDERIPVDCRGRYLTYMGEVFADYVDRLLRRAYPPSTRRYLKLDDVAGVISGKYCDGLVDYGNSVILIEAKATLFTLPARTGSDILQINHKLQSIFTDAAEQFHNTVSIIESGVLWSYGFTPSRIQNYYPLVITLEDIPMNRLVYEQIEHDITSNGLLVHPKIRPLQCCDVGELEYIETAILNGTSFESLLSHKVSSQVTREESFVNYLYDTRPTFANQPNSHLQSVFSSLGEMAKEFFKAREKAPPAVQE